jgi:hypothetical protein
LRKILTSVHGYEQDRVQLITSRDIFKINFIILVAYMGTSLMSGTSGFGGLGVACWPLVPKFASSNAAEAVGFLRAKKSSTRLPSEGK